MKFGRIEFADKSNVGCKCNRLGKMTLKSVPEQSEKYNRIFNVSVTSSPQYDPSVFKTRANHIYIV